LLSISCSTSSTLKSLSALWWAACMKGMQPIKLHVSTFVSERRAACSHLLQSSSGSRYMDNEHTQSKACNQAVSSQKTNQARHVFARVKLFAPPPAIVLGTKESYRESC
jgi:hypothetical protein